MFNFSPDRHDPPPPSAPGGRSDDTHTRAGPSRRAPSQPPIETKSVSAESEEDALAADLLEDEEDAPDSVSWNQYRYAIEYSYLRREQAFNRQMRDIRSRVTVAVGAMRELAGSLHPYIELDPRIAASDTIIEEHHVALGQYIQDEWDSNQTPIQVPPPSDSVFGDRWREAWADMNRQLERGGGILRIPLPDSAAAMGASAPEPGNGTPRDKGKKRAE